MFISRPARRRSRRKKRKNAARKIRRYCLTFNDVCRVAWRDVLTNGDDGRAAVHRQNGNVERNGTKNTDDKNGKWNGRTKGKPKTARRAAAMKTPRLRKHQTPPRRWRPLQTCGELDNQVVGARRPPTEKDTARPRRDVEMAPSGTLKKHRRPHDDDGMKTRSPRAGKHRRGRNENTPRGRAPGGSKTKTRRAAGTGKTPGPWR